MNTIAPERPLDIHANAILASTFANPSEVLSNAILTCEEKRAVLAAWASDAFAVEGRPWHRQVPGASAAIPLSEIFQALRTLDDDDGNPPDKGGAAQRPIVLNNGEDDDAIVMAPRAAHLTATLGPRRRPAARMLAEPVQTKAAITAKLCTVDGLASTTLPRRDKAAYAAARRCRAPSS